MADIVDVRKALFEAYREAQKRPDWGGGKRAEGEVVVYYDTFWTEGGKEDLSQPRALMIYSYLLGPSRQHWIIRSEKESKPEYYEWHAPDIFAKALEVIAEWREEMMRDD